MMPWDRRAPEPLPDIPADLVRDKDNIAPYMCRTDGKEQWTPPWNKR